MNSFCGFLASDLLYLNCLYLYNTSQSKFHFSKPFFKKLSYNYFTILFVRQVYDYFPKILVIWHICCLSSVPLGFSKKCVSFQCSLQLLGLSGTYYCLLAIISSRSLTNVVRDILWKGVRYNSLKRALGRNFIRVCLETPGSRKDLGSSRWLG